MATALLVSMLLVPASAANAADGCGDDWYKESDGYFEKDGPWQGVSGRNAWVYHTGRVRFCTQNDFVGDDQNRRVLIGYPQDSYALESYISKNGGYASFCVTQILRARISDAESESSWSVTGSVSKGDAGVSTTYTSSSKDLTIRIARNKVCGPDRDKIYARTSGMTITGNNDASEVEWVELTTRLEIKYNAGGALRSDVHSLVELDYS